MLCSNVMPCYTGGDSKTLMVVQVAPVEKNVGETMCSLMFAERVRAVELGKAAAKKETAEIAALKEKLKEYEVTQILHWYQIN